MYQTVSIVVPAHNEEGNIAFVLRDIIGLNMISEIIIVDDHSSDKTYEIVKKCANKFKHIKIIQRKSGKRGMGASLKEGTLSASGEIVIWMMADRSDDLRTVPRIIEKIHEGFDLVFASRYMRGGSAGDLNKIKAFLSNGYSFVCRLLFRFKVHDITNAFRGFRKSIFLKANPESDDFAISPEFAIKAKLKGFKLAEVPTIYTNRIVGKNNFHILKMGLRYISLFRYALRKN
jgi:glycosyltransferase involved in cell wall biosynthesis